MSLPSPQHRAWWKESSVYQIYPSSFCTLTPTPAGTLHGILSKTDYIQTLGIDIVWLCPIFESPKEDMGYDISDYMKIDPIYGDIEDVDKLIMELHKRDMKLLLDLVVNHTSDQHEWFKESRKGKDNKYRDWYIWREGKRVEGKRVPPNNWTAHFGGSAWQFDEASQEYYLHLYEPSQPDLNWANPAVRTAVHTIMRFWLSRGVDGFRMDVINFISKPQDIPDGDPELAFHIGSEHYGVGPSLHEYLHELGDILREYDAFNVGEMPCVTDLSQIVKSVGYDRGELNMIFHFELHDIDHGPEGKFSPKSWKLTELKRIVERWQTFLYDNGGWNALYLENHDQPRSIDRFANASPAFAKQSAKMLATFIGCQAGTLFVYQGQELGMTNIPTSWGMEDYKDVDCLNHWKALKKSTNTPATLTAAQVEYQKKSRDNARTPMPWSSRGEFSPPESPRPWMRMHPDYKYGVNAEDQLADPTSVFRYWASVLAARKKFKDVIIYGDFKLLDHDNQNLLAYERNFEEEKIVVVCNFSDKKHSYKLDTAGTAEIVLSSHLRKLQHFFEQEILLEPYEAWAIRL
ncbi:probable alpha-glucosidase (maltase) [Rhynchosporium graminicola]|uniref:Probable alpha-glucosidase (Maltase) n=1 Tax=Rhynchosporium graminicola TaxID=2792576 RepID=A0A1E1LLX2_9HELO|nr:probable alpha-glucosidase (maltase) [Rhynchosporium commune]